MGLNAVANVLFFFPFLFFGGRETHVTIGLFNTNFFLSLYVYARYVSPSSSSVVESICCAVLLVVACHHPVVPGQSYNNPPHLESGSNAPFSGCSCVVMPGSCGLCQNSLSHRLWGNMNKSPHLFPVIVSTNVLELLPFAQLSFANLESKLRDS